MNNTDTLRTVATQRLNWFRWLAERLSGAAYEAMSPADQELVRREAAAEFRQLAGLA